MWFLSSFSNNFQLDVVGFLAILGEGSVLSSAQVLSASNMSYIPRLIPAPQALFRAQRPHNLPTYNAQVSTIYSGNARSHINHVAHLLLDKNLRAHTVRCVNVKKNPDNTSVRVRTTGPVLWATILGCASSIALLATSAVLHDGMSLIATAVLSLVATLAGYANRWDIQLPKRGGNNKVVDGNLVIRYPNGSFLIVICKEEVARELYFAPEEITYKRDSTTYQMISLLGTSLLMVGVICLANAKLALQFMWAGLFILLNVVYWLIAALPSGRHWDLSCYRVEEHAIEGGQPNESFTTALWKAIAITRSTGWAEMCQPALPQTEDWKTWAQRAKCQAQKTTWRASNSTAGQEKLLWEHSGQLCKIPDWDAHKELAELHRPEGSAKSTSEEPDTKKPNVEQPQECKRRSSC